MAHFIIRSLPNTITCCNLFCGCLAAGAAFQSDYRSAFMFIVLGAVFDFFDGLVARALHVSSSIGKELDSLADVVTFGVAPATIAFSLLQEMPCPEYLSFAKPYLPYWGFLIAVFSGLRLAKFNVDDRQTSSFIGMPTPANALFWASASVGAHEFILSLPVWVMMTVVLSMSLLLVAELPMFSLKFKNFSWQQNKLAYFFLAGAVFLLAIFRMSGFAAVILWYILLSLVSYKKR